VLSVQKLGRFVGAQGTYQPVVELDTSLSWLPNFLFQRHTTFIAVGTIDAYVDFSKIDGKGITVDWAQKSATISLPRSVLEKPNLDNTKSHIVGESKGFTQWVHDAFSDDPNREQKFYQLGEDKIRQAALASDLRQRSDDSVRAKLTQLCQLLGFTSVAINFVAAPSS
jgi:hypothetical protein